MFTIRGSSDQVEEAPDVVVLALELDRDRNLGVEVVRDSPRAA